MKTMMSRLLLTCLCALALLSPRLATATHIVGGEMELQYQQGSTYTLTLNLYFDAINGNPSALDQLLISSIFEKSTNQRIIDVTLPLVSNTFVSYTNPICAVGGLSTRKLVYRQNLTLSAATYTSPAGYYVAVERCCRNLDIRNIRNPGAAAQAFYLEFPAVVRNGAPFIDSTPRIFPALGDYACVNELFYFDFGGQDADGDSLVYDMVTPLNGHSSGGGVGPANPAPYALINWTTGLGTNNQIPGTTPLSIDAHSGRLMVRPSTLGLFVFGVRCSEYRRGVKIGETRRDFQLYVLACAANLPPQLQVQTGDVPVPYRPGRDTLRLLPGANRCLTIRYTDPNPNSVLTLTSQPVNFTVPALTFTTASSGTVRVAGAPDTLSASLCFPACADTGGRVYLLDVIVADNGCSQPKRDTVRIAFTATQAPNTAPALSSSFPPPPLPPNNDAPVVVRVPYGQRYSANLAGADADLNQLTLTAAGTGFDLAAVGMQFTAQNGKGQASGTFVWEPDCAAVAANDANSGLLVRFTLNEFYPCEPKPQERVVRFEVAPAAEAVEFRPPNVITPNGDEKNDVFALPDLPPDYCGHEFASVRIFSRWGQLLYQSPERSFRWGGAGVAGTYYYLVSYTDGRKFKGWLEVIP
jgi:gliding motility-associated-like protein